MVNIIEYYPCWRCCYNVIDILCYDHCYCTRCSFCMLYLLWLLFMLLFSAFLFLKLIFMLWLILNTILLGQSLPLLLFIQQSVINNTDNSCCCCCYYSYCCDYTCKSCFCFCCSNKVSSKFFVLLCFAVTFWLLSQRVRILCCFVLFFSARFDAVAKPDNVNRHHCSCLLFSSILFLLLMSHSIIFGFYFLLLPISLIHTKPLPKPHHFISLHTLYLYSFVFRSISLFTKSFL